MDLFSYNPPEPRYPLGPGYKDSDTSRLAAESMAASAPLLRQRCLEAIQRAGPAGLTADECAARLDLTVLSIRPRITELYHSGQIVPSGERRPNASGRSAKVWIAP